VWCVAGSERTIVRALAVMPSEMAADARRNASLLWLGQSISQIATEVAAVSLPLVALTSLHATAGQVGLLRASVTAPTLALSLLVGAWADRARRQPLLIASCVLQFAALAIAALLVSAGALGISTLLAVALLVGLGAVVFDVAYPSLVPTIVPPRYLPAMNSRLFAAQSTAEAIGPGIGGALLSGAGAAWALLGNAAAFLTAGGLLSRMACDEADPPPTGRAVPADIWTGLRAVLGHRLLRPMILASCVYNFWYDALLTVFLTHAVTRWQMSAAAVGGILGSATVGAVAGSAASERLVARLGLGRMLVVTYGGAVLLPALMLAAHDSGVASLAVLSVSFATSTFCTSAKNVQSVSLRQLVTPRWALGRMSATAWFFVLGSLPLGAYAGGRLGDLLGTGSALTFTVLALPVAWLVLAVSPVRTLRSAPGIDHAYWARYR
jgi:predicted MFS family arabinose efflux permease